MNRGRQEFISRRETFLINQTFYGIFHFGASLIKNYESILTITLITFGHVRSNKFSSGAFISVDNARNTT